MEKVFQGLGRLGQKVASSIGVGSSSQSKVIELLDDDESDADGLAEAPVENGEDEVEDGSRPASVEVAHPEPQHLPAIARISALHPAQSTSRYPWQRYRCPAKGRPLYTVKGYTITIHASDGDSSLWPSLPLEHLTASEIPMDDKAVRTWNSRIGQVLAKLLHLGDPSLPWKLAALPAGYKLFMHRTAQNTNSAFVHAAGSTVITKQRKFKTTTAFANHIAWLCKYGDDPSATCACKHCIIKFVQNKEPRCFVIQRMADSDSASAPHSGERVVSTSSAARQKVPSSAASLPPTTVAAPRNPTHDDSRLVEPLAIKTKTPAAPIILQPSSISKTHSNAKPALSTTHVNGNAKVKSSLGKRKQRSDSDSVVDESEDADARVEKELVVELDAKGRPKRTTRNNRVLKDLTPPPKSAPPPRRSPKPKVEEPPRPVWPGAFVNRDRQVDIVNPTGFCRKFEVVWHILEKPFVDPANPQFAITHWPGLVTERRVITNATIQQQQQQQPDSDVEHGTQPTLRVNQRTGCLVRLLATHSTVFSSHNQVIPYLAYTPHELMKEELYSKLLSYNERPYFENLRSWRTAITPWVLARQITVRLRDQWSLADPYWNTSLHERLHRNLTTATKSQLAKEKAREEMAKYETYFQSLYWGCEKIWSGEMVRLAASWKVGEGGEAVLKFGNDQRIVLADTALASGQERRQVLFKIGAIVRDPKTQSVFLHGRYMQIIESAEPKKRQRGFYTDSVAESAHLSPVEHYDRMYLPYIDATREFRPLIRFSDPKGLQQERIPLSLLAGRYYQLGSFPFDLNTRSEKQARNLSGRYYSRPLTTPGTYWHRNRSSSVKSAYRAGRDDMQSYFNEESPRRSSHTSEAERRMSRDLSEDIITVASRRV